jgi:hypothetical protein
MTSRGLKRNISASSAILAAATLLILSGCASIRRHEAASTEQLLAAAGFQRRPANPPAPDLAGLPPLKLVARSTDGNVVYTYADPANCQCLYVGGPREYSAYQRMKLEQRIANDNAAAMNRGLWGPRWW